MKLWIFLFPVALGLVGCGDPDDPGEENQSPNGGSSGSGVGGSSGSGGASGSSGTNATGGGGSGGTAPACNTFEANAPEFPLYMVSDPMPAGLGGTILDGTYFVTSETWYESPLTQTLMMPGIRTDIAGTTWQETDGSPDGVAPPGHFTEEIVVNDTSLTLTRICPGPDDPFQPEYTAEGDTLTLYVVDGPSTFGFVFTRQ